MVRQINSWTGLSGAANRARIGLTQLLSDCPRLRSWDYSLQGQRLCEVVADVLAVARTYRRDNGWQGFPIDA